jgi:hypothetical protein
MALNLYSIPDESGAFTALSPFTVTFDGRTGGSIDRKIYLRNDHPRRWYSNITLEAVDTADNSVRKSMVTEGVPGFFWKLAQGDRPLYQEEWELVAKGNNISIASNIGSATLGDITTYLPIWIRVRIPENVPISTVTEIVVRVIAKENYVSG